MQKNQTLIIPAILWILGIIIARQTVLPILFLMVAIPILLLLSFNKKFRFICFCLVVVFLGILRYDIKSEFTQNSIRTILETYSTITQPIQGRIISEVKSKDGNYSFILELHQIKESKVTGKIKFYTRIKNLYYGDIISVVATIKELPGSTNPASFDYKEFLDAKMIFGSGYSISPISKIGYRTNIFNNTVISIRKYLRNRINDRFGEHAGFVKAIVIAEKDEIDAKRSIMCKAGLSHLLAVSGLHVGLLSLIILSVLNAFIPKRNISRIIIMCLLIVYAAICLWAPSVTRAAIMIILFFMAKILQRKPIANNILFASLIIITAINPNQLFSVGLQMSYLAVFILLNVLPRFRFIKVKKEELEYFSKGKQLLNGILILICTSFILNIFLAPLTAYNFHQFGFNGIAGNLLGIPLIGMILPLSLIIVFLPEFIIPLFQNSFQLIMLIFEKWTSFSANLPLHFDFVFISIIHLILLYFILTALVFLFKSSRKQRKWLFISIIFLSGIFILLGRQNSNKLTITFFDCGLGDLALIQTAQKETILIDTGPPKKGMNSFTRSALPYLQKKGISSIDHVLITHAHNDHYGGVFSVFENLEVKNLIVTDEFQNRKIWNSIAEEVEIERCSVFTVLDTTHISFNEINFKIIHPDSYYKSGNINNLSIVVRLDYGDLSVLFTGDLEREGEDYLINNYPEFLDCDVLKVGHHGSKTASSPAFIKVVDPQYAIISTAKKNRFNFPHKITLVRFEFLGPNLMITGYDGACQIVSDGNSAQITTVVSEKNIIDNDLK
ncbi:MAG: DNA internalization-related competence protein ComEC/Rec2 [Candidatus Cloacimonadota bacterium]|nr:DNA internalization-related competence protein ComEC/Rec2 [Candidatus Cloacimonadota bacterium]